VQPGGGHGIKNHQEGEIMNTEIIVHGALAVAVGLGGYWRVKKGDREGALFFAGAQPSIAIALSLFDLGNTFGDMQNALAGGGIFEALSLKMFHMTVGIGAGLAQEGITQFYLPIKAEEERSRESIKDAVVEGIASQIQEMNKQVRRVGQIIESVPNDIDGIMRQSTDNIKNESVKVADLVQSSLVEHGKQATETFRKDAQSIKQDLTSHSNAVSSSVKQQSEALLKYAEGIQKYSQDTQQSLSSYSNTVSASVKQATETFHKDAQSIKQDLTSHSNVVSSSVKQATESAADTISSRIKQEMEQTMTEAARQGGDVILSVATQVTKTLQATTSNSMMATANLAKTSDEALQRIANLVPR